MKLNEAAGDNVTMPSVLGSCKTTALMQDKVQRLKGIMQQHFLSVFS